MHMCQFNVAMQVEVGPQQSHIGELDSGLYLDVPKSDIGSFSPGCQGWAHQLTSCSVVIIDRWPNH